MAGRIIPAARPRAARRWTVRRWRSPTRTGRLAHLCGGRHLASLTGEGAARETLTDEVLGSHVRSRLMPGHLTDVAFNRSAHR